MDNLSGLLVLAGFIAFFVLMVWLISRSKQNEKAARSTEAQSIGFSEVENPDPALLEQIRCLYNKPAGKHLELRYVFRRLTPDGELLLYDLWDTSGEDSSQVAEKAFALRSSTLNLPTISIYPRVKVEGRLGQYVNQFLKWSLARKGSQISFEDVPEFNERYTVIGDDEASIRETLDVSVLSRLSRYPNLMISGSGGMVTVSRFPTLKQPRSSPEHGLNSWMNEALNVLRLFME